MPVCIYALFTCLIRYLQSNEKHVSVRVKFNYSRVPNKRPPPAYFFQKHFSSIFFLSTNKHFYH